MAKGDGAGRPHKLTPEMHENLVKFVRNGNYYCTSAKACGISPDTFNLWLSAGRKLHEKHGSNFEDVDEDNLKYLRFFIDIKKSESNVEAIIVGKILNAADHDWRAGMTYLERKRPDKWGKRDTNINKNYNITPDDIKKMTTEELEELAGRKK